MNLQPITGTPFAFRCASCGARHSTANGTSYADLDGEPFVAYYDPVCAAAIRADANREEPRT